MRNISLKRRMIYLMRIASILLTLLIIRVGWIQFINGEEFMIPI